MDRAVLFGATTYTLFGLATVFTIGRALSRWHKFTGAGYGSDDWTGFFTYASIVGLTVANYFQLANGMGQVRYGLDAKTIERFLLWAYVSQHFYIAVIFGCKLSLVLSYLRAWRESSRFRFACLMMAVTIVCAWVAFEIVAIVHCLPVAHNWTFYPGSTSSCIDQNAFGYSLASVDIAFNVVVLVFPISRLLKSDRSLLHKICISTTFFVGLAVIAISATRLKYLGRITTDTNMTWNYSYIGLYSSIEALLSQICCCIPAFLSILDRNIIIHRSSRLSGGSRKSASTPRSNDRNSGTVIGIKGIGPSEPDDPEKALSGDDASYDDYERAPSPTIGLSSHRSWNETITSRSQLPIQGRALSPEIFQRTFFDDHDTPTEASREDLQIMAEGDEDEASDEDSDDESPFDADAAIRPIGMPSIVHNDSRRSEPRPVPVRLSTYLVTFMKEVNPSTGRADVHSW